MRRGVSGSRRHAPGRRRTPERPSGDGSVVRSVHRRAVRRHARRNEPDGGALPVPLRHRASLRVAEDDSRCGVGPLRRHREIPRILRRPGGGFEPRHAVLGALPRRGRIQLQGAVRGGRRGVPASRAGFPEQRGSAASPTTSATVGALVGRTRLRTSPSRARSRRCCWRGSTTRSPRPRGRTARARRVSSGRVFQFPAVGTRRSHHGRVDER